jgi:hypothetical protein
VIEWDCSSLYLLTAAFGTEQTIDLICTMVGFLGRG